MDDGNGKQTISQEVLAGIRNLLRQFFDWLKPSPQDHWGLQVIKLVAKIPVVLLAIALSPLLLVVLLLVFLIAL